VSRVPTRRGGRTSPPAPAGRTGGTVTGRRDTAARYAPAAAAALVMAVLGAWGLARDSAMGNDEVATRYAALLPLHLLARLLRHVDAVHGLYYLLMHGWMVAGASPVVMRIPSVIAMTAGAALVAIIGWRLTRSGWAALFAGLIMALTPTISFYAQTARSYALVYLCVAGATLVLLHALDAEQAAVGPAAGGRPVLARWVGYAALISLAGYLNELALLVLLAHGATVLLARYGRRTLVHWAVASAVAVVIVAPLAALSATEGKAVNWIPRPGLWSLRILFQDYFGASMVVAVLLLACAVVAVLPDRIGPRPAPSPARPAPAPPGEAGTDLAPWWRRGGVSLPSVAAPLLVLPGAVLIAESLVARPLYVDRYVLYGEAGAALLAGAGAYRLGQWLATAAGRRGLLWVPGAVVCVLALILQLGPQHRARTPQSRLYDFGGPSRYLAAHAQPGDGVLFISDFFRKMRLGYPADFRNVSDFSMAASPAQVGDFLGRDKPFTVIRPLMLGRQRIWVIGRMPSLHLTSLPGREETAVLQAGFTLSAQRHFKGVWVTLWRRR
jgi:mannosyltransferase